MDQNSVSSFYEEMISPMSPCGDDNNSDGPPSIISTGRVNLADRLPTPAQKEEED